MKWFFRIILFTFLASYLSCEEQGFPVHCYDCTADEPVGTDLEVRLNYSNSSLITIQIYEGNLEDNVILGTFTTQSSVFKHNVKLNKKYTITATYYILDNKYIAVDSAVPRVLYEKSQCSEPCYFVYDRICDLRLKFTK